MNKKQVRKIDIEDKSLVCPYCMIEVSFDDQGCCGESSAHFETAYLIEGELYLKQEVEVIK